MEEFHWDWDPKLELPIHSRWILVGKYTVPFLVDGNPLSIIHGAQDFIFVQRLALVRNLVVLSVRIRLRKRRVGGRWELSGSALQTDPVHRRGIFVQGPGLSVRYAKRPLPGIYTTDIGELTGGKRRA